ncbi:hypothetical protein ACD578_28755 (plasmid) [Microvirga sp. RSM25]|uniref:hypothetical protein n=1 Tax=Microvirga sp. RSM25 TaxID=3273802 RepID=UPI00384D972D
MPHEAYCVADRGNRWSVIHRSRDLGAFRCRTNALKFAVTSAHSNEEMKRPNIDVLDRSGDFYTAWDSGKDVMSLDT